MPHPPSGKQCSLACPEVRQGKPLRLEPSSEANESGESPGVGSARRPCFLPSKSPEAPGPGSTEGDGGRNRGDQPPNRGLFLDLCVSPKAKAPYREPFFWNYGPSTSSPVLADLPSQEPCRQPGQSQGVQNRSRLSSLCSTGSERETVTLTT